MLESFFNKEAPTQKFASEYYKTFNNSFFKEHPWWRLPQRSTSDLRVISPEAIFRTLNVLPCFNVLNKFQNNNNNIK